jgi:hypothetical protein
MQLPEMSGIECLPTSQLSVRAAVMEKVSPFALALGAMALGLPIDSEPNRLLGFGSNHVGRCCIRISVLVKGSSGSRVDESAVNLGALSAGDMISILTGPRKRLVVGERRPQSGIRTPPCNGNISTPCLRVSPNL